MPIVRKRQHWCVLLLLLLLKLCFLHLCISVGPCTAFACITLHHMLAHLGKVLELSLATCFPKDKTSSPAQEGKIFMLKIKTSGVGGGGIFGGSERFVNSLPRPSVLLYLPCVANLALALLCYRPSDANAL